MASHPTKARKKSKRWITPKLFRKLYGIPLCAAALHKRLARPDCPKCGMRRGATGRIVEINPSSAFIRWLRKPLQKGPPPRRSSRSGARRYSPMRQNDCPQTGRVI